MELWRLKALRGPNVWAAHPVLEAGVDLEADASRERIRQAIERVGIWFPSLRSELVAGDYSITLAHVLERVALHLQTLAGQSVTFARTRSGERSDRFRVAVAYLDEAIGMACLQAAVEACRAAWMEQPFAFDDELTRLRRLADERHLEPNTRALLEAAQLRDIPVERFHPTDGRYLLLGHGARQRRSRGTETEVVSGVARSLAADPCATRQLLREAGVPVLHETDDSALCAGYRLLIVEERMIAATRMGDDRRDVTEQIHPEVAACAVAAAQALRLRVAGVDVVAEDVRLPLEEQKGGVIRIVPDPDLSLHTASSNDPARSVAAAVVRSLFPAGETGRIPIVAVTGSLARAAGRCLALLLTDAGFRVGRASRDGVFVARRKINLESATAHDKARAVLRNSQVDVAVLEAGADDLLREGFGGDRCDVALLTDSEHDASEPETREACSALFHALAPGGKIVMNADDPPVSHSSLPSADRVIWFASSEDNARLVDHRAAGGVAVFLCADSLAVARGNVEQRLAFGGCPVAKDGGEQLALLTALAGAMAINLCGGERPIERRAQRVSREPSLSVT